MLAAITQRIDNLDNQKKCYCNYSYLQWFQNHHISTIMIMDYNQIDAIVSICDMLIINGGYDVHPSFYAQEEEETSYTHYDKEVDNLDLLALHAFHQAHKPVLGICRGLQVMNVYFAGTLFKDIKNHQNTTHPLLFAKDGLLHSLYKDKKVNSYHHQAIDRLGHFLKIEAISEDGIIEAVSYEDYMLAVQWHPELMENDPILLYFLLYLQNTSLKNKQL